MGTPALAARMLEACLSVGEVVAVVTQPDKPSGRGQKTGISEVKALALARGLPVLQPSRLRNTPFAQELAALRPDVVVVAAYGKILPQDVLDVPPKGCVNVHASLLPRFRGAAPIQWALAMGDERTGVCLMHMDAGMDTGSVIARAELIIAADETTPSLTARLAELGHALLLEKLPAYLEGGLQPIPQSAEGVVMAPMLRREDGRLDFQRSARELERRTRAFQPWPGAYTRIAGQTVHVRGVRLGDGRGEPGALLTAGAGGLEVACGEGSLWLDRLQPEGKRVMTAHEFLLGRRVSPGEKL